MGYTHYWHVTEPGISPSSWDAITKDVKHLFANLPEHSASGGGLFAEAPLGLVRAYDRPSVGPEVSENLIAFNGKTFSKNLGHEDFRLERQASHESCKTARKPYDLAVCAVLMVALRHAPEQVRLSLDDGYVPDWQPALDWVTEVLGPGYDLPRVVKDRTAARDKCAAVAS